MSFYGSVADADAYHAARGNVAWASLSAPSKEAALTRASDYLDQRYKYQTPMGRWSSLFVGVRTNGRGQDREWPRTGAEDYEGAPINPLVTPVEVCVATYEASIREAISPGSLNPDYVPGEVVQSERVDVISTTYAIPTGEAAIGFNPARPVLSAVDEILAPLLRSTCGGLGLFVV